MNFLIRIAVISLVIIVSDLYFYRLLNNLFIKDDSEKKALKVLLIGLTIAFILFEAGCFFIVGYPLDDYIKYRQLFLLLDAFILVYLPKIFSAVVIIIYDLLWYLPSKILRKGDSGPPKKRHKWIYYIALLIFSATLTCCIYGFTKGKTDIRINKMDLEFRDLPESFEGFRIVQISDIHLGSFKKTNAVENYVAYINKLSPDILVMTGDMINVNDKEIDPYQSIFSSINPPYGKFAILGNHDMGDYFKLKNPENIDDITKKLISGERKMGFTLLMDSACFIKKGNDSIALIGVKNWGMFPFKKAGNLKKAMQNLPNQSFKILLSHDSNHWRYEVEGKQNIQLTLSGHTHGMQLGFSYKKFRLSPSHIIFKFWMGLYSDKSQLLYVNPGLGYSGFSARIGIRPEITLLVLHCSK